jgi:lipopolysaccharide export LptBFGC system permease protein LptF
MKLEKREKVLAIAAFTCLVMVLISYFVLPYAHNIFNSLHDQIASSEKRLKINKKFLQKQKDIYEQSKKASELFGQKMNDQEWTAQTTAVVHELAQSNHIKLEELNSGVLEHRDDINTFKLQVTAIGDWGSIVHFLNSLQDSFYRFDVEELELEKYSGNPGLLRCQMLLSRWALAPSGS